MAHPDPIEVARLVDQLRAADPATLAAALDQLAPDPDPDPDRDRPCGCPRDHHLADCPHLTDRGWGQDPAMDLDCDYGPPDYY